VLKLGRECRFLKGVGPVRAEKLKKLGILTVDDLVTHYPRTYYDRRNFVPIAQLAPGEDASMMGQVLSVARRSARNRRSIITAAVGDESGIVQVVWFNQDYLYRQIKPGNTIVMNGELTHYRGARQVVNPEFEILGEDLDKELLHAGRIVPVYRLTGGISQRFVRGLIARTLDAVRTDLFENLPTSLVSRFGFPSRYEAIREIHFPSDRAVYDRALARLKFEELFFLQLVFYLHRRGSRNGRGVTIRIGYDLEQQYLEALPFSLTGSQQRVLHEIHRDFESGKGMQRLLQGDVGSGKTVVAGAALVCAAEAGYQAAFMVPTEILAMQHRSTLGPYLERIGVSNCLLIGALSSGEKETIHRAIADGSARVVIGTHALIQEQVAFKNLGLVIIDEQHRFGVRQRAALLGRGNPPHLLVMTATPIPRTLALTAYADLDLSSIDEMPPGRVPVVTRIVEDDKRERMLSFIKDEIAGGSRVYFLYPLIEETEKSDLQAATSAFRDLSEGFFAGYGIGLLHGKMPHNDKNRAMEDFASGRTQILVSTTVVEVGVHVPEATIMVVNHPERFGLSQLHQIRGRVGRGHKKGYCFLLLESGASSIARQRLRLLTKISDGFKIAEEDLKIRGPGEFFGTRQHGVPGFKLANPIVDRRIVEDASTWIKAMLARDPRLEHDDVSQCRKYLGVYTSVDIGLVSAG
jgi:ATP-dependent DNA helicase RecG